MPDFFTISGQKLGLPAGAALIYRKEWKRYGTKLRSEYHQISRVPVPFIRLLAECLSERFRVLEERYSRMCEHRARFLQILGRVVGEGKYHVTVSGEMASPYIIHLMLHNGIQGAIIVRALTLHGISVSYGSACDAETDRPSGVLLSMGYSREESYGALRISFSGELEEGQMYEFAEKLLKTIEEY
jgi:cysteine desulfurase